MPEQNNTPKAPWGVTSSSKSTFGVKSTDYSVPSPVKELDNPNESPQDLEGAYEQWRTQQTPSNLNKVLKAADPVIKSGLTSYGGGNQALRSRAKKLAIEGIKKYDPKKGTKLSSHLHIQLQPLRRDFRERTSTIKVPERVSMDLWKLKEAEKEFFDEFNRESSDYEIASKTGLSVKRIRHLRRFDKMQYPESGVQGLSDEGDSASFYPATDNPDPEEIWLEFVHHDSNPIDQKIMEWKTGYNGKKIISNKEIAKRLNISPGAVSQRSAKIAKRLAEYQELEDQGVL